MEGRRKIVAQASVRSTAQQTAQKSAGTGARQGSFSSRLVNLFKLTWQEWSDDNGASLSAALAYYTVFSLAPILVIAVAIAGLIFGRQAAEGELVTQLSGFVGEDGASLIQTMLANAAEPATGGLAAALGLLTLLFGATGAFSEMQNSMNHIWDQPKPAAGGIWAWVKTRAVSFLLVMGTGLILLASLLVGTLLAAAAQALEGAGLSPAVWRFANYGATFTLLTLAFAVIYRTLPDVRISWRDVWAGAILTSVLFAIARFALGFYLANNGTVSTYGAAGSLVVLLIWIYFSAQLLFLGAEFTQVYSRIFGSRRHEVGVVLGSKTQPPPSRKRMAPAGRSASAYAGPAWQAPVPQPAPNPVRNRIV
jgi:membrane protein